MQLEFKHTCRAHSYTEPEWNMYVPLRVIFARGHTGSTQYSEVKVIMTILDGHVMLDVICCHWLLILKQAFAS